MRFLGMWRVANPQLRIGALSGSITALGNATAGRQAGYAHASVDSLYNRPRATDSRFEVIANTHLGDSNYLCTTSDQPFSNIIEIPFLAPRQRFPTRDAKQGRRWCTGKSPPTLEFRDDP